MALRRGVKVKARFHHEPAASIRHLCELTIVRRCCYSVGQLHLREDYMQSMAPFAMTVGTL